MDRSPLNSPRVWVLHDGAAGNRRQAETLATRLGTVDRSIALQTRWPWRGFAPRKLPGAGRAFAGDFAAAAADTLPDLAVGCGRQAALATRLLRERGVAAVQVLAPRMETRFWDCVVTPMHDDLRGDNVIHTVGSLHAVDDDALAAGRHDFPKLGKLAGPRTALLLGGPTRSAPFERSDWKQLRNALVRPPLREGSLMVSSSGRTPDWLRKAARQDLAGRADIQWHDAGDGPNPYGGLLGWADRIVVTADSVNMLSEACATGVPVYSPLPAQPRGRLARFHQSLLDAGHLRPLGSEDSSPPPVLREIDSVVRELRQRLQLGDSPID